MVFNSFSQSPEEEYPTCPATSYLNYFEKDCGNFVATPEEILLGQARVLQEDYNGFSGRCTGADGIDLYIPENKPGWAIALAHTHRISSNFLGGDYLSINHLFATAFQESTFKNGIGGEIWPDVADHNVASDLVLGCGFGISLGDGYYHTDINGRGFVAEINPTRFPTAGDAGFVNNFEENTHLAMIWNHSYIRTQEFAKKSFFTSFMKNAKDPYAGTKLVAGAYNQGQNRAYLTEVLVTKRDETILADDILPYMTHDPAQMYAHQVSGYTQALDAGGNSNFRNVRGTMHEWYDRDLTWQDVSDYIDKICPIYVEVDCAKAKAQVKAVFDAINAGGVVSFRYEFSTVIDELTVAFPYYEPEIHGTNKGAYKCNYSCTLPFPTIDYATPTTFCEGLSVELTTIPGDGYTYQWYKGNELIAEAEDINYFATETGKFSVVVTDPNGCSLESNCPVVVTVNNCTTCSLTVDVDEENVSCSGYADGGVQITAGGVDGPFMYQLNSNMPMDTPNFNNLKEGNYAVEVVQLDDPTCKGFASFTIDANKVISNKIELEGTEVDCESTNLEAKVISLPPSDCQAYFDRKRFGTQYSVWPKHGLKVSLKADGVEIFNTYSWWLNPSDVTEAVDAEKVEPIRIKHGAMISMDVINYGDQALSSGGDTWEYSVLDKDENSLGKISVRQMFPTGVTQVMAPFEFSCATEDPIFNYEWTPLEVLSNTTDLTATATVESRTLVKITATNEDDPTCPLKDSVYVTNCNDVPCVPPTKAKITSTGGLEAICEGDDINLSVDTDQPDFQIQWAFKGGDQNGANGLTYLASEAGLYTVKVVDPLDETCFYESSVVESFDLMVNSNVTPSIEIKADKDEVCKGGEVTFSIEIQENEGDDPVYTWVRGGAYPDAGGTFIEQYEDQLKLTLSSKDLGELVQVNLEMNSSFQCVNSSKVRSNSITIPITSSVTPTIEIGSTKSTICEGQEVGFFIDSQSHEGSDPLYEWFVNEGSKGVGEELLLDDLEDGDQVKVELTTDDQCADQPTVTSNSIEISLSEGLTPTIEINRFGMKIVEGPVFCEGDEAIFMVVDTTNHGMNPAFEWFVNGELEGVESSFSSLEVKNNDIVTCKLTSSEGCVTKATVWSNEVIVSNASKVIPLIEITSSAEEICIGDPVGFFITSETNEGSTPNYEWFVNGEPKGSEDELSLSDLSDGDEIKVVLTSSEGCVSSETVESNSKTIKVSTSLEPSLNIFATTPINICENESVSFEVLGGDGLGANATYEWFINGEIESLAPSEIITLSGLVDDDVVTALASNLSSCATLPTVSSEEVSIAIIDPLTPKVEIVSDKEAICEGENVTFDIHIQTNEGASPNYQWLVNDLPVSSTDSYNSKDLTSSDLVSLELTVTETCVTTQQVKSSPIQVSVTESMDPSVTIEASSALICPGEQVDFKIATSEGEGDTPSYEWLVNGEIEGTSDQFSSTDLTNNAEVILRVGSSLSCVSQVVVESNALIIEVVDTENLGLTLTSSKNPVCQYEEVSFEAETVINSGMNYKWYVNDEVVDETGASFSKVMINDNTKIRVEVESSSTCGTFSSSDDETVAVEGIEYATFSPEVIEVCSDKAPIELKVSGLTSTNMQWVRDGEEIIGAKGPVYYAAESGYYGVNISSLMCGDFEYGGAKVKITAMPEVDAGPDLHINKEELLTIQAEVSEANQVLWTPSDYLNDVTVLQPEITTTSTTETGETIYTLTATNGDCVATDEVILTIYDDLGIYSAFSPNGDGVNDVWLIPGAQQYPNSSIKVYNRWGGLIFTSYGYDEPWDGTFKGKELPVGTYYYVIELNNPTADPQTLEGSVTIIR